MKYFLIVLISCLIFKTDSLEGSGEDIDDIYNRIDFRYPNEMVDPPVKCETNGTFAHPRKETWFYRCHSSDLAPNYYKSEFFECAPGTSFLTTGPGYGICVKGKVGNCSNCNVDTDECDIYNVCVSGGYMLMRLCKQSSFSCPQCEESPCEEGLWYRDYFPKRIASPHLCYDDPATIDNSACCGDDCLISTSKCQIIDICSDGKMVTSPMCPIAIQVCGACQNEICEPGQLYSMLTSKCMAEEDVGKSCNSNQVFEVTPPEVRSSGLDHIECSPNTPKIPKNQWIKDKHCSRYEKCNKGRNTMGLSELCTDYYQCEYEAEKGHWIAKKKQCPNNMLMSLDNEICVALPEGYCPVL